jgi:hypothetical protein
MKAGKGKAKKHYQSQEFLSTREKGDNRSKQNSKRLVSKHKDADSKHIISGHTHR